ncbi:MULTISPECIES: hypothetical protein [unclassified Streptomyces]|nr:MULTISPECIES: hypothetical protein [unclassified Streptomyces]MCH0566883.1 hypothetical protein [Streptomyces sp. MUM 2J]MCH0569820.1 hypothetical protein [Streptomyces sp. MUM 136J]
MNVLEEILAGVREGLAERVARTPLEDLWGSSLMTEANWPATVRLLRTAP